MYSVVPVNRNGFYFDTKIGNRYSLLFNRDGLESVELFFGKTIDIGVDVNDIYNIMSAVMSAVNSYLSNNLSINLIILDVTGIDQEEIDQKSILFTRYVRDLPGKWEVIRENNVIKLNKL